MARRNRPWVDGDKLFRQYEKMIYKLANGFSASTGIEVDDLISVGNEVFVNCLAKWDIERASFSTLLYRALINAFQDEVIYMVCRQEVALEDCYEAAPVHHPDEGKQFIESICARIGRDAQEVVRVLLEENLPFEDGSRTGMRRSLKRYFRNRPRRAPQGELYVRWTLSRISRAFREIENAVQIT